MISKFMRVAALVALSSGAMADDRPLMCFGTEPFWSVDFTVPGTGRFTTPDGDDEVFEGVATRLDHLGESLWRGQSGDGETLVALLRDEACSDNMSDTVHPVSVRVAHPDGRFLAGCCRQVGAAEADPAFLEGPGWRVVALSGVSGEQLDGLPQHLSVRFEDGRVSGFSGCNRFSGAYEVNDGQLVLGNAAGTMMSCAEPAMTVERSFLDSFSGTLSVAFDNDRAELGAADGAAIMLEREPPPSLEATGWKVTGFNNGRQAVVGPMANSEIVFEFQDGKVSGNSGCNRFNGPYSVEGDRIAIGPLMTTRRACPEALMTQEQQFLAALETAVQWRLDGATLDMHREDGERAIWAVKD